MNEFERLGFGLGGLPFLGAARTRSVCPENPGGEKGAGGMAVPDPAKYPFSPAAGDCARRSPPGATASAHASAARPSVARRCLKGVAYPLLLLIY